MNKKYIPCICLSMRRAAGAVTTYYDRKMEPLGISLTQFSIMINIKSEGQINMGSLAKILKLEKSTLTRTLAPLIEKGFIYSQRGENRREVILTLTDQGQDKMKEAFPVWCQLQKEMTEYLGGEEAANVFVETLSKLQALKER